MREIVLDTETTGLDPVAGDRIIEIGCVELLDHYPTGNTLQIYLNPERPVGESERIHGIKDEFLADKPLFAAVVEEFFAFIGDAPLVIHNAGFDLKFLNAELHRIGRSTIPYARAIDTIEIAKNKIPGARYSLDELCRRYGVDLSARAVHGALLDARLTAEVYLELVGGRQRSFALALGDEFSASGEPWRAPPRPAPLENLATLAELEAHAAFIARELGEGAVWNLR
jgi:DNA polymerase-3 subunit epsilon